MIAYIFNVMGEKKYGSPEKKIWETRPLRASFGPWPTCLTHLTFYMYIFTQVCLYIYIFTYSDIESVTWCRTPSVFCFFLN